MIYKILLISFFISYFDGYLVGQPFLDRHTTNMSDAWLSCEPKENPIKTRGKSHWIQYDLGEIMAFGKTTIWNFNVPKRISSYDNEPWSITPLIGSTEDGFKDFYVDVSTDGENWTEIGLFQLPEANASSFYEGYAEIDLNNHLGRYIVFTPISNYGGSCYGLSEVRIEIAKPTSITNKLQEVKEKMVGIYPNPTSSDFEVRLYYFKQGKASLLVSDIQGRKVYSSYIDIHENVSIHKVSLSHVPNGLYTCTVISGNLVEVKKVEIIH